MLEQVDYIRINYLRVDKERDGWEWGLCHPMSRLVPKELEFLTGYETVSI